MTTLKQRYSEYNDRLRASGIALISLECPCCSAVIETKSGVDGEKWHSMAQCPECEGLFKLFTEGSKAYGLTPCAMNA